MSFTFKNEDGDEVKEIWSCNDCIYCSTRPHFREDDGELTCPMCFGSARKIDTQVKTSGMTNFQYRKLRDSLQTQCDGVGDATITNIEEAFPDGQDFVDACEAAYQEQAYDELTHVSGVGNSTARALALAVAEMRNWEDGKAEMSFDVA